MISGFSGSGDRARGGAERRGRPGCLPELRVSTCSGTGTLVASEGFRAQWPHAGSADSGRGPFPQAHAERRAVAANGEKVQVHCQPGVLCSRPETKTKLRKPTSALRGPHVKLPPKGARPSASDKKAGLFRLRVERGKPRVTDLDRAFAGPSPTPAKKRGPARWAKVPGRRQPPPAPPRPGRARSGTCEGPGVGLPALLAAPRGPHVDPVRLARLQARQDGAVPLPGDRGVPGLPVGGGVAHHVFVYGSPDGLPGDRHRVFCHLISDHIGRAINFFIKTHEEEKLEKPRGRTRSQRRHDPVHLGDLVPEPTPCRKVLPPPVTGRHPASA